ncbi:MAG: hypothetical protein B6I20_04350 [Bacteroidetes bacterium 4572_117]|nr:MAG: hypothetical protein B6I20_04350 [Bacteroidetes bacterium 4572_117]
MKVNYVFATILIMFFLLPNNAIQAQDEEPDSKISVSASMVSSYIWRGGLVSATPNIQPSVSMAMGDFSFGFLGSTDLAFNADTAYKEIDFFVTYSTSGFSATFYDYFWHPDAKYFNYKNESTGHVFELEFAYENEGIPFKISTATMFYGDDKKHFYDNDETDLNKSNFSTYVELGYTFTLGNNSVYTFLGLSPFTGMYGNDFSVINLGFSANRDIKITDKFTLPVFVTIAANPQTEIAFFVFGFSL